MVVPIVQSFASLTPFNQRYAPRFNPSRNAFNGLNRADAIERIERFERVPPIGTWREKLKT
jgi:hypothetical protein